MFLNIFLLYKTLKNNFQNLFFKTFFLELFSKTLHNHNPNFSFIFFLSSSPIEMELITA